MLPSWTWTTYQKGVFYNLYIRQTTAFRAFNRRAHGDSYEMGEIVFYVESER